MAAKRLSHLSTAIVAVFAASAAWLTGGALTLTSIQPGAERIGVLPSPVWLPLWLLVAFMLRAWLRRRGNRFVLLSLPVVLLAPWLPFRVPSAFYIWTGTLRSWLWVVVVAGLAAPVLGGQAPGWLARLARDPRRAPWLAGATAAVAYLIGAYQISPRLPTGDEPHYLVIAQSILRDHDLKIENNHRRGDYREYYDDELRPDYLRRGVNGEIYSVHAPGLAVIVAPAFAVLGYAGVLVFLALLSAWATALAWMATWRMTADAAASWFGWATVALTAPFFFQSFVVYPDAPGAALIMAGVLALVDGGLLSTKRLVAVGAALAMLPWLHTRYVAAAVMLGAMILARLWTRNGVTRADRGRRAVALLSVPIVSAACWFGFFYAIYGSPDPRGPYGGGTQSALANLPRGAIGLLFDQQFGVLPAAPVLLCAFAGLAVLVRRAPRLAAELLILIAPYGLVVGAYQMWWGGNSSPGRFVIPVLLPMAIPAGVWFQTRRGSAARLLGLGALTVSLLTTFTLATVDRGVLLYNFRDGSSRLFTWLSPLVNITTGLPSVFQTTPSAALLHGLVWIAAIAATAAIGVFVERRGGTRTSVAVALGFSAIVSATVALTIVWRDHDPAVARVTPATGAMALLRRYDPDSGQFAVRDQPLGRLRMRDILANVTLADTARDPESRDEPAVSLFDLPAGTYAIDGTGGGSGSGLVTATIDDDFGPQWSWRVGDSPDTWQREIRLPVPARVLAISASGARHLTVRPTHIAGSSHQLANSKATRIARYGSAVVFLMGGHAFMERGGTWVEGGRSADFVISPDEGGLVKVFVRNPPVANLVTLEGDGWREVLTLSPGEERIVTRQVAAESGGMRLRATAAHGARPTEFERGSTDTRFLGCWIETRP
jgi:hypothetical protein